MRRSIIAKPDSMRRLQAALLGRAMRARPRARSSTSSIERSRSPTLTRGVAALLMSWGTGAALGQQLRRGLVRLGRILGGLLAAPEIVEVEPLQRCGQALGLEPADIALEPGLEIGFAPVAVEQDTL